MADGHGGVGPFRFLHEDQGQRLAHDVAPADDDDVFAVGIGAVSQEQLLDAVRRARDVARIAGGEQAEVLRAEPVYVLNRRHRFDDRRLVNLLGQRQLHENAMHGRVVV